MFKNKRVFVSGGAGVIGRELVQKLYQDGAKLLVGDLKPKPKDWPDDISYRMGDLNWITKGELDDFSPEYFFHLAATFERSEETYGFWYENFHHNVNLAHHLMTCLKDSTYLKRVVFASSYLIYDPSFYLFATPQAEAVSLKETSAIYPRNLTGVAKLLHELELRFLEEFRSDSFSTVSARIFRVYGKGSEDVISRWIRMALNNEKLKVYRPEGIFDYIYAGDVAEGLLRLAESDVQGIVNLGTGRGRRVAEVLSILKSHFPDLEMEEEESDILYEASRADMGKFQKAVGWLPSTGLEEGIAKVIEFQRLERQENVAEETIGNILVTSASKKVPLFASLKAARAKLGQELLIFAGDLDGNCIARYFADRFWQMPALDNLTVDDVIAYCQKEQIKMIIPTRDGELMFFAENRDTLAEYGISVLVSNCRSVKICLDKLLFYQELNRLGYPVIKTVDDITQLDCHRYVVKDRFGAGSNKIGLNLSLDAATRHAALLKSPIYQPFIEGQEYSVDVYITKQGIVKGVVARTRDVIVSGESQVTTTVRNQALEEMAAQLAMDLSLYGHVVMQVLIDQHGQIHIIEVNSRFGGASTLSLKAGLDSFYWFILESAGQSLDGYRFARATQELKLVRHPQDEIILA